MNTREQRFMQAAIAVAREGMLEGRGGPFGCVIVLGEEIIGRGCNSVVCNNDPTAHAEVMAIREACQFAGQFSTDRLRNIYQLRALSHVPGRHLLGQTETGGLCCQSTGCPTGGLRRFFHLRRIAIALYRAADN